MNKVICDICGTAYPDTAPKCPICGYAKTAGETATVASERRSSEGGYSAVKGGRFSKQNVRKRNSGKTSERSNSERSRRSQEDEGGNTGLILVVIFLLVAIVAVVVYIGMKVFNNQDASVSPSVGTSQVTQPTTDSATTPTDPALGGGIACESLQLSNQTIEFINAGDQWPIQIRTTPSNTTDAVTFESSDPAVVTVDDTGLLTAVGAGQATITVKCGTVTQTCQIKCSFENPPTDPVTNPTTPTDPTGQGTTNPTDATTATTPTTGVVDPDFTFAFRYSTYDETTGKWDTTLSTQGETWTAYKNNLSVDPGAITWTSDDPSICTVQNGIVTAVAPGKTEIHATYGGKTYTCIVRCKFAAGETGNTNTGNTDNGNADNGNATGPCTISSEDMTIAVGNFWWLRLKDANGKELEVTWKAEDGSIVSIEGNKIYGEKVGKTTVSTTYDGVTYTCIVRIKAAE